MKQNPFVKWENHKVSETHITRGERSACVCVYVGAWHDMHVHMHTVCANVTEAINYSIKGSPRAQEKNKSAEIWMTTSSSLIGFSLGDHFGEMLLRQNKQFKINWNITPRTWCRRLLWSIFSQCISVSTKGGVVCFTSEVHFSIQKTAVPRLQLVAGTRSETFFIQSHVKMADLTA